ncbi:Variant surface glycoprotein, partial [Trypanosoma congolense IL3000]
MIITVLFLNFKEVKAMLIMKFSLVALVLCVDFGFTQPSAAEFNLFCRIWMEANDMMLEPDYVYDEDKDQEIVKEIMILFNATTDNMEDFPETLWGVKDFLKEHPPPTHSESRKRAHREIGNLIMEGEKKIQESRDLAKEANQRIEEARLSAAQGFYGDHVKRIPKNDRNLTEILENTSGIFNHNERSLESCGEKNKSTGKTLLNDFFCVCVGTGVHDSDGPCSPHILPPNRGHRKGGWKAMKYASSGSPALHLNESIKTIEKVCKDTLDETSRKNILGLLAEYVKMIWNGKHRFAEGKKIFGHSGRKDKRQVSKCDGSGVESGGTNHDKERNNADICVDYTSHFKNSHYDIPWHNKFKNYSDFMEDAKQLEDQILKNRADLLLLKSQAWDVYSREKGHETSNLDDKNVSIPFDSTKPTSISPSISPSTPPSISP